MLGMPHEGTDAVAHDGRSGQDTMWQEGIRRGRIPGAAVSSCKAVLLAMNL